ncbi:hypothetical protein EDD17DRAFT_295736 [Pisolithus thermaeus]|nr:hypothetical protein EDD17DRAFT_295736 [Pisolithus thermaeus]
MIDLEMQKSIRTAVCNLWEEVVLPNWSFPQKDYVFDLLLTRDLSGGHVIDFNPHAPHTDPSLFTYEELHKVLSKAIRDASARWTSLPELRVIGSPLHPAATHKMLAYRHNRLPIEALTLSESRNIMEFGEIWREEVTRAVREDDVRALTCACLFCTVQKGLCSTLNRDFSTTSNKRTLSNMEWKAEQTRETEGWCIAALRQVANAN